MVLVVFSMLPVTQKHSKLLPFQLLQTSQTFPQTCERYAQWRPQPVSCQMSECFCYPQKTVLHPYCPSLFPVLLIRLELISCSYLAAVASVLERIPLQLDQETEKKDFLQVMSAR